MHDALGREERRANHARFRPGERGGMYESYFQRANHPTRPLAFWIRYTVFSPRGRPSDAVGELWAIYFDGERGRKVALKCEVPAARCSFDPGGLDVRVDGARLAPGRLSGAIDDRGRRLAWSLEYGGGERPLLLFPPALYRTPLPRAKVIVGVPNALYAGTLEVDGETIGVEGWRGSQNHNWGSKHTDEYAWAQIAGFDDHPDSFLEVATARQKIGPLSTPFLTPLVLRHRGREYALRSLPQAARARGGFTFFDFAFASEGDDFAIEGRVHAPRGAFVGLRYRNPPGGVKHCLNSKLASCEVTLRDKRSGTAEVLRTTHRAAFEILTDDPTHGVEMLV
jgi:hypothetical protein